MIIQAFTDGERKNKIAEFYDTQFPTSFLRGLLEEAQEDEAECKIMFTCRQEPKKFDLDELKMSRAELDLEV